MNPFDDCNPEDDRVAYVLIEPLDGNQIKGKYDSWFTPWSGFQEYVIEHLDDLTRGETRALKFTILTFTADEMDEYCEQNDIELD